MNPTRSMRAREGGDEPTFDTVEQLRAYRKRSAALACRRYWRFIKPFFA